MERSPDLNSIRVQKKFTVIKYQIPEFQHDKTNGFLVDVFPNEGNDFKFEVFYDKIDRLIREDVKLKKKSEFVNPYDGIKILSLHFYDSEDEIEAHFESYNKI